MVEQRYCVIYRMIREDLKEVLSWEQVNKTWIYGSREF